MADAADLLRTRLPSPWNYGVTEDGRVFFVNDDTKSTTWLHPATREPVQTGLTASSDLPRGWEHAFTPDGVPYFINHNDHRTTFVHPVTGEIMAEEIIPPKSPETPQTKQPVEPKKQPHNLIKKSNKKITVPPQAKRSEEAPVSMKGWLHKQEGGTIRQWKKRWFVLSDYCLFSYKSPEEGQSLGSVLLPSYKINPCTQKDGISRKFAFKAEHQNMRTYYFAADNKEEMQRWMNAMSLATILQRDPKVEQEFNPPSSLNTSNVADEAGFRHGPQGQRVPSGGPPQPGYNEVPSGRSSASSEHPPYRGHDRDRYYDGRNGHVPPNRDMYDGRTLPNGYARPDDRNRSSISASESSMSHHGDPRHRHDNSDYYRDRMHPQSSSGMRPQHGHPPPPQDNRGRTQQRQNPDPRSNRSISLDRRHFHPDQKRADDTQQSFRDDLDQSRTSTNQRRPESGDARTGQRPYNEQLTKPQRPVSNQFEMGSTNRGPVHTQKQDSLRHLQQWHQDQMSKGKPMKDFEPLRVDVPHESQKDLAQNERGRGLAQDYGRQGSGSSLQGRPLTNEEARKQVQKQESLRHLREWHDRMSQSSAQSSPNQSRTYPDQNRTKNPLYENIPPHAKRNLNTSLQSDTTPVPGRPPYPAALRRDFVEDIAAQRTPHTSQDMLMSSQNESRRLNEPLFFQYPEAKGGPPQQQDPNMPDSYLRAKRSVEERELQRRQEHQMRPREEERPAIPESYLRAKQEMERQNNPKQIQARHDHMPMQRSVGHQDHQNPQDTSGKGPQSRANYERLDNYYSNTGQNSEVEAGRANDVRKPIKQDGLASTVNQTTNQKHIDKDRDAHEKNQSFEMNEQLFRLALEGPVHTGGQTPTVISPDSEGRILSDLIESYQKELKRIQGGSSSAVGPSAISQGPSSTSPNRGQTSPPLAKGSNASLARGSNVSLVRGSDTSLAKGHDGSLAQGSETFLARSQETGTQSNANRPPPPPYPGKSNQQDTQVPNMQSVEHIAVPKTRSPPIIPVQPLSSFKPKAINRPVNQGPVKPSEAHQQKSPDRNNPHTSALQAQSLAQTSSPPRYQPQFHQPMANQIQQSSTSQSTPNLSYTMDASPSTHSAPPQPNFGTTTFVGSRDSKPEGQPKAMDDSVLAVNHQGRGQGVGGSPPHHSGTVSPGVPGRGGPFRGPQRGPQLDISTVKEDPDMSEDQIIATNLKNLKKHFAVNGKVRLSISAADLLGKSHEELVLLLIELRRKQSRLETTRNLYRQQLDIIKDKERDYQRQLNSSPSGRLPDSMERDHQYYMELKMQNDEVEKQLEVHKPLVNLVDNLVKMGSLYGGDNDMLASQYKRHLLSADEYTPPRKLLDFSRKLQEEKLAQNYQDEVKQLTEDEVNLEEKLQRLYELDRALQEKSFMVTSLQEDKEMLEKALSGVKVQLDGGRDLREATRLAQQEKNIERELSKVRQQLAENSKVLEELTTENAKVEHEVMILRSKVHGMKKSHSTPSLSSESAKTKQKLEQELSHVREVMNGLNKQGKRLSEAMQTLRNPYTNGDLNTSRDKLPTYNETDLDRMETRDIGVYDKWSIASDQGTVDSDMPPRRLQDRLAEQDDTPLGSDSASDNYWDISEADDNTKRFFGLLPRDRPRVQTVRDVKKRETERRSRDRERRRGGDNDSPDTGYTAPQRSQSLPRRLSDVPSSPKHKTDIVSSKELFVKPRKIDRERRQSAAERLFPVDQSGQPIISRPSPMSHKDKVRRNSELGLAPKPFYGPSPTKPLGQSNIQNTLDLAETPTKVKPKVLPKKKKGPPRRGVRYQTISSSMPIAFETTPLKRKGVQTAAGDLITNKASRKEQDDIDIAFMENVVGIPRYSADYVRSTTFEKDPVESFEKDVLFLPQKVEIPERYVPDSDEENLTEAEKAARKEKAERIRKMLSAHSLQDWTQTELNPFEREVHKAADQEKHRREHLLDLGHALAKEVSQKTKQVAAQRRKTWSSDMDVVTARRIDVQDYDDFETSQIPLVQQRENLFS